MANKWTAVDVLPGTVFNVRAAPTIKSNIVIRIVPPTQMEVDFDAREYDLPAAKWWYPVRKDGMIGWAREDVFAYKMAGREYKTRILIENVPYFNQNSQSSLLYTNDCGPACVRSVIGLDRFLRGIPDYPLRLTIDVCCRLLGLARTDTTTPSQLVTLSQMLGVKAEVVTIGKYTLDFVIKELEAGRPSISLIAYGHIKNRRHQSVRGGHYILPIGITELDEDNFGYIIAHDPDDKGYIRIPIDQYNLAISDTLGMAGNSPNQGVRFAF